MKGVFGRKWNPALYTELKKIHRMQILSGKRRVRAVGNGLTMPSLETLQIGSAKRMTAAILFFDLVEFTSTTSYLENEQTLHMLNCIIPILMTIARKWNGYIEKNTGDGIMAILGTETTDNQRIAVSATECALTMRYFMANDIRDCLEKNQLPVMSFRISIDMEELLISRIGIPNHNFITVVGDAANRAAKLQELARVNGICLGENIANQLPTFLYQYLVKGESPVWKDKIYSYFHLDCNWSDPVEWVKILSKELKTFAF